VRLKWDSHAGMYRSFLTRGVTKLNAFASDSVQTNLSLQPVRDRDNELLVFSKLQLSKVGTLQDAMSSILNHRSQVALMTIPVICHQS